MRSLLEKFRVLDLTDERGLFCGKILADLGADVIKIEKPGGDTARRIGPFYKNIPDPEKSLYWFFYNLNKRSITLNIETAYGQELFKKLVKTSDFVIESFPPGYMDSLGLSYSDLRVINPRIITTSITPFGQTGPFKDYKASDIVVMAMGGLAYITGSPESCPVRISFPQAYLLASAHAAAATMIAHYYRQTTGGGQHVDVSAQACVAGILTNLVPLWQLDRAIVKRQGAFMVGRGGMFKTRNLWRCKDGYVISGLGGGRAGAGSQPLVKWIDDEGGAPEWFRTIDFASRDMAKETQESQNRIEEVVAQYFMKHTKAELYEKARQAGFMLCPVSSCKDIIENTQLQARDYWVKVEHPELGDTISYPGAFIKASKTPCIIKRRAPLIGEHNQEIYEVELGLSRDEICMLKEAQII